MEEYKVRKVERNIRQVVIPLWPAQSPHLLTGVVPDHTQSIKLKLSEYVKDNGERIGIGVYGDTVFISEWDR